MLDQWKIDDLDRSSRGEVALEVFEKQTELEEAQKLRAKAARKHTEALEAANRAADEYNLAVRVEEELTREVRDLSQYLKKRTERALTQDNTWDK